MISMFFEIPKFYNLSGKLHIIRRNGFEVRNMEKRSFAILGAIVVIIVAILLILWVMISGSDNGLPFIPNGDNGGTQIDRTEWAFEVTQIKDMNKDDYKGEGIVVGIVDTGIDPSHPDLDHINITGWMDNVNSRAEPYDDQGHGTHIAGIIAAQGEIDGVAPDVKLVVVKAISSGGSGSDSDVADGIDYCVEKGADVICLSLGGMARLLNIGDSTAAACEDAIDAGVYVVAAAGNDGEDDDGDVSSPAVVDGVIAVGAIDEDKRLASFSSIGDNDGILPFPIDDREDPDKKPELVAPGVDIVSTYLEEGYATASGTSQATAFVAGCIAILLDADSHYKRDGGSGGDSDAITQVKNALMNSAEKLSGQDTPHDDHYGYGLIKIKDTEARL
jgi:subtilisin family serine protease